MKPAPLLFFAILCACAPPAWADKDPFADVTITSQALSGPVHMLKGAGGNLAVSVGADGVLLVDDQFAPLATRIQAAITALGHGGVRWLVNTHWHGDHTGGNEHFGTTGATIVAHDNVRVRLATDQVTFFGKARVALAKAALPVVTFADGMTIHFNGEPIAIHHLPGGHTDGDAVVHFTKSNVWHLGDLFFNGAFPLVDITHGGGVKQYVANMDNLLKRIDPGAKIIPGHGDLATHIDLKTMHTVLVETIGIVEKRIAAGQSLKEAKAAGLPERYAQYGSGFIKTDMWIQIVCKSLGAAR